MRIITCLGLAVLVTSCGPNSSNDGADTTSKTTTVTTSTTPAAPPVPVVPVTPLSTLTQENLDRIQNDMSQAEVEAILGQPTSSQSQPIPLVGGTQTTYNYQSGTSAVTIIFKNDQVKQKSGTFNP